MLWYLVRRFWGYVRWCGVALMCSSPFRTAEFNASQHSWVCLCMWSVWNLGFFSHVWSGTVLLLKGMHQHFMPLSSRGWSPQFGKKWAAVVMGGRGLLGICFGSQCFSFSSLLWLCLIDGDFSPDDMSPKQVISMLLAAISYYLADFETHQTANARCS